MDLNGDSSHVFCISAPSIPSIGSSIDKKIRRGKKCILNRESAFFSLVVLFALRSLFLSHILTTDKKNDRGEPYRLLSRKGGYHRDTLDSSFSKDKPPVMMHRAETSEPIATTGITPPPKVLLGIFTAAKRGELKARMHYRKLFQMFRKFENSRVCSLDKALQGPECELVYTFVLGGNQSAANETNPIMSSRNGVPLRIATQSAVAVNRTQNLLAPVRLTFHTGESSNWTGSFPMDFARQDMTFLNIAENMNHGKTPSWFYYAHSLADRLGLDYVAKCDSDSVINVRRYFDFAAQKLPPAPYNRAIYAGKVMDKLWWGHNWRGRKSLYMYSEEDRHLHESMVERYSSFLPQDMHAILHLFMAGQLYILSTDLVQTVVEQLANPTHMLYAEGEAEDHDISSMIYFHQKRAVQLIMLSPEDNQFWDHPFKFRTNCVEKRGSNKGNSTHENNKMEVERTVRKWEVTLQQCQEFLAVDPQSLLCKTQTDQAKQLCNRNTLRES